MARRWESCRMLYSHKSWQELFSINCVFLRRRFQPKLDRLPQLKRSKVNKTLPFGSKIHKVVNGDSYFNSTIVIWFPLKFSYELFRYWSHFNTWIAHSWIANSSWIHKTKYLCVLRLILENNNGNNNSIMKIWICVPNFYYVIYYVILADLNK